MDIHILEDIGLTYAQAMAYKTLVKSGLMSAPALADAIGESRTNGYKVLDRLVELGLAVKESVGGKFKYSATSPAALEQLVRQQAEDVRQRERRLNAEMPHLLDYYFEHSERPSIRYFEGIEGITSIYKDQVATGKEMYYVRSMADLAYLQFDQLHRLRNLFPRVGITRHTIIQDSGPSKELPPEEQMPIDESDKHMLLHRTWIHEGDYTAPVEWVAYGDKVSIIQYGEEAMGMIIESAPIAEAFRQIYKLLDEGIRRRPEYPRMPLKTTYTAMPEALKNKRPE